MFEWDESKNRQKLEKHAIAFEDVLSVFGNREALALEDKRRDYGEPRYVVLCPLKDVLVHVTYTVRGGSIRLISPGAPADERSGTMDGENLTRAVLTQDGRVLIEQPDGSYRPAASRTDWDRVRAMRDEEVEAAAAGDPDAPPRLDEAFRREARVVFPRPVRKKHNRPAHRRGRAGVVPRPRTRLPDSHERRAARLRRGPEARRPIERRSCHHATAAQ